MKTDMNDIQQAVWLLEEQLGWSTNSLRDKCFFLSEEVGELFKAIRKGHSDLTVFTESEEFDPAEECADILFVLCAIANRLGADLGSQLRSKLTKLEGREYVRGSSIVSKTPYPGPRPKTPYQPAPPPPPKKK